ncbi:conserved hypothetical protein [Ricinus communis]|uniref:Zinc finger GRF-type domain-containing protein n=1 Tax=Ricinus communis TaxID=3988 RepID=B9T5S5_RICCO|nr:conserved hypothetical protein [Ricinus communis]
MDMVDVEKIAVVAVPYSGRRYLKCANRECKFFMWHSEKFNVHTFQLLTTLKKREKDLSWEEIKLFKEKKKVYDKAHVEVKELEKAKLLLQIVTVVAFSLSTFIMVKEIWFGMSF